MLPSPSTAAWKASHVRASPLLAGLKVETFDTQPSPPDPRAGPRSLVNSCCSSDELHLILLDKESAEISFRLLTLARISSTLNDAVLDR